jgi:hypothetical protein
MLKNVFSFFILFVLIYVSIDQFRSLKDYEKWSFIKTGLYSLICAIITVIILITIVLLF